MNQDAFKWVLGGITNQGQDLAGAAREPQPQWFTDGAKPSATQAWAPACAVMAGAGAVGLRWDNDWRLQESVAILSTAPGR